MYISQETSTQTQARLRKVIAEAELLVYDQPYVFEEVSVERFPSHHIADALAFVRDSHVWSALVPQRQQQHEAFSIFSFHFPSSLDNSGFVRLLTPRPSAVAGRTEFTYTGQHVAASLTIGVLHCLLPTKFSKKSNCYASSKAMPNPSLHPTRYSRLRLLPRGGELKG